MTMLTDNIKVDRLIKKLDEGGKLTYDDMVNLDELELNLLRIFKTKEVDYILHPKK